VAVFDQTSFSKYQLTGPGFQFRPKMSDPSTVVTQRGRRMYLST
jgi:hypothetical protein